MARAAAIWARLKGWKLYGVAGVITAAEVYVQMGGRLPYSDDISPQWRIGLAALLTAAGFVLRGAASMRGGRK